LLTVKFPLPLLSGFAVIGALSAGSDDVLPSRFNFDRYTRMVDQSPFAIATAAALPEATPDFAKDLYVANAAHSPEGDMVTIMSSSDQNFKKYLTTTESVDGYGIASIEWSDQVGTTKVTISKDGKLATLTFNQALLSAGAPHGPLRAGPTHPSMPSIPLPVASQASGNDIRAMTQRDPKVAGPSTANPMAALIPNVEPPQPGNPQQQQLEQQRNRADHKRKEESYQR
jgi:hypothetical protein